MHLYSCQDRTMFSLFHHTGSFPLCTRRDAFSRRLPCGQPARYHGSTRMWSRPSSRCVSWLVVIGAASNFYKGNIHPFWKRSAPRHLGAPVKRRLLVPPGRQKGADNIANLTECTLTEVLFCCRFGVLLQPILSLALPRKPRSPQPVTAVAGILLARCQEG